MGISHAPAGIGRWAAQRVDIFVDSVRVGIADLNPMTDLFVFEPLIVPSLSETIESAQRQHADEARMGWMMSQRDEADRKLKAAMTPDNRAAINIYVRSIRPRANQLSPAESGTQVKASAPVFEAGPQPEPAATPEPSSGAVIVPQAPVPAESGVDHNKIIMLENRVDRIDNCLKRIESRLIAVENSIEQFDIRGTREKLDLLGTQISNLRAEYKVTAANFRIHQQRCYCNHHFPGGFTKRDETPEDTNSAHASSKP